MALKHNVEETIAYWYYLRSFGIKVIKLTAVCEDNLSVLNNSANLSCSLQKEHVALACHFYRQMCSAGVVNIRKVHAKSNLSDRLTKSLDSASHHSCFGPIIVN